MTSFGKQQRFLTTNQTLPSVWNYDTGKWQCNSRVKTTQSVSIGRSKRSSIETNPKVPGPGAYDLITHSKSKAPNPVLIGKPKAEQGNNVPGPGSYSADASILLVSNPKFSMTGNCFNPREEKRPSPWDYSPNLNCISKTDPAIKFAQDRRESKDEKLKFPGPGDYNPEVKDDKSLKFSFGSEQKFHTEEMLIKEKNKVPGPGQYRVQLEKKARGYKFLGSKRQTFTNLCLPGPGDYLLESSTNRKSCGFIIAKSPRLRNQDTKIPGPIYQIPPVELYKQSMRRTAVSFSKSKKDKQYKTIAPGPGAYQTEKTLLDKNAVTIKGRATQEKPNEGPGPLDYNPNYNCILNKSPCAKISDLRSQSLGNKEISPGPCSYKTEDDYKVKSFYFPKSNKDLGKKEVTPGPGHYSLKPQFESAGANNGSMKAIN